MPGDADGDSGQASTTGSPTTSGPVTTSGPGTSSTSGPPSASSSSGGPCVSDFEFYSSVVLPDVIYPSCYACHNDDTVWLPGGAADTNLVFVGSDIPNAVETNYEVFMLAATTLWDDGQSLLLLKPTGAVEHQGGKRFEPGSPEYLLLQEMLERALSPEDCQ
jgi:hypothetical protein